MISSSVSDQTQPKWGSLVKKDAYLSDRLAIPADDYDRENGNVAKYFPIHKYQREIIYSTTRFTAAIAGTGGGKTVCGPIWFMLQMERVIKQNGRFLGMIIAPTYKVLARATMPCFVESLKGTQYEGRYLESKSQYILPNNWGVVWCQGADNPGGLEGGQFDAIWGDEGGQFKNKTFHAIVARTGAKEAPILITTTPYLGTDGFGTLHTEWYERHKLADKNYKIIQWSSFQNPAYPKEEYDRMRRTLTPEKFAERYDGLFVGAEGRVYPAFHRTLITLSSTELYELMQCPGKFVGGIDFGWNDPFAATCGLELSSDVRIGEHRFEEGTLINFYERYKSQTTIEAHADALVKVKVPGRSITWYADHNPELIVKLKKRGLKVIKAPKLKRSGRNGALVSGIVSVNQRIYTDKFKVVENKCPAIRAEAEQYVYPEKDEIIIGEIPIDKDNHAMDAMRYQITGLDRKKAA